MTNDPFEAIKGSGSKRRPAKNNDRPFRRCIVPVPPEAPAAPERHPKLGKPSATWTYRDQEGAILGHVMRFEEKDGGKSFRPLCLFESAGKMEWRWEAWPAPRPLFGCDRLAARRNAPVAVCEGEKAADAAQRLLPDFVCTTSPSGSKSAGKADWSPLADRAITVWPDADDAGRSYAEAVAQLAADAGARSVAILAPPDGASKGWDAGDAESEGWTAEKTLGLVAAAKRVGARQPFREQTDEGKGAKPDESRTRPRQRDQLLEAVSEAELWHDQNGVAYSSIMVNGHREHRRIDSQPFRNWIAGRFYQATGGAVTTATLTDAIRVLTVRAIENGPCHKVMLRTGWDCSSCWVDLCDDLWRAARIWGEGWEVVDQPPVRFVRSDIMTALPKPEPGHLLEELRGFVNASDADYELIVGWLVAALWGRAKSYPILALGGEQGSGKSTMSRLLPSLVDPSAVAGLSPPKDERDLIVSAGLNLVLAFDNVS